MGRTAAPAPFTPGLLDGIERPRRVVVVRPSRIGDLLCALPAFGALRHALPDAEITLIGLPFARDLVERSTIVDGFEPFPGFPGIAEQWFDSGGTTRFLERMQRRQFDLAIQLYGSGANANPFTLLLGARHTAGFVGAAGSGASLDAALPLPTTGHEIDRALALTTFLGAAPVERRPSFPLAEADRAGAERLVGGVLSPLIGVHAAASDADRRWPTSRFAAAAGRLRERFGGTVVTLSGDGEAPLARAILDAIGGPALDLSGRTTLPVLGAVIERLDVLVTTDSGPAHVAYAVGAPSVTLFGPSRPERYGPPRGRAHRVVAADDEVIDSIQIDEVVDEAAAVLADDRVPLGEHCLSAPSDRTSA